MPPTLCGGYQSWDHDPILLSLLWNGGNHRHADSGPAGHEVLRFSFSAATKDEARALVQPFVQFFAPIVAHAFFHPRFFAHPSGRGAVLCRRNPPSYLGYFPLLCLQGNEHVAILFPFVRRPPYRTFKGVELQIPAPDDNYNRIVTLVDNYNEMSSQSKENETKAISPVEQEIES